MSKVYSRGNSKLGTAPLPFSSGDVIEEWNLMQLNPHTVICSGVLGLTFYRCNLVNCDVPEDAIVQNCLHLHKSFCSHLHPDKVDFGLSECDELCSHVTDIDEVIIDNELVDTIYTYSDMRVE